jgi:single-stranded-DNA-specific exonuclease
VLSIPFTKVVVDGIIFFVEQPETWLEVKQVRAVYKLSINEYKDQRNLQLQISYLARLH